MEDKNSNLDEYFSKIFKLGFFILFAYCLLFSALFTIYKALNLFENVSWNSILIYDFVFISLFLSGIVFVKKSYSDGYLKPGRGSLGKFLSVLILTVHWNMTLYMIPSQSYWAIIIYYLFILAYTLDIRLIIEAFLILCTSLIISWLVKGADKMGREVVTEKMFITETTTRFVLILLSVVEFLIFIYFIRHYLINSLKYHTEHDALTGIENRESFNRLKDIYSGKRNIVMMMIDADNFKTINDTMGHEAGDQALIKIASTLKRYFRTSDHVIRFGGDEFIVLLPDYNPEFLHLLPAKMESINKELLEKTDGAPPVSVTCGIAFSSEGYTDYLKNNADAALYVQKEQKRGGTSIYSDDE